MHETTSENALDGGKVEMKKEFDFQNVILEFVCTKEFTKSHMIIT